MSDIRIWGKIFRAAADIIDKETEDKPRQRQRHIPSEPVDELARQRARAAVTKADWRAAPGWFQRRAWISSSQSPGAGVVNRPPRATAAWRLPVRGLNQLAAGEAGRASGRSWTERSSGT